MKTNKIFSLAVLALLTAACSSDIASEQQGSRVIPFTATLSAGTATTRAIDMEGYRLVTFWKKEEQVALIHNGVMDVMEVTDVDDKTGAATISGNLTGDPQDGDDVTVIYPASAVDEGTLDVKDDLLEEQDGDLGTISQQLDLRKSTGAKLQVVGETASLKGIVSLKNQLAIVQLGFKMDNGDLYYYLTQLTIKDGNSKVLTTVNETVENTYWIAMAPAKDATFSFEFIKDGETYTCTKTGVTLEAGKYYNSTLTVKDKNIGVTGVTLSETELKLTIDETATLVATITPADATDQTVSWKSSDESVATVDQNGKVTAVGAGEAIITVTTTDGEKTAECKVTVSKKAGSISFATPAPTQTLSDTPADNTYKQTVTNIGDGMVTYSISDNTCGATINASTGKVTFTQVGSVKVTATVAVAEDGIYSYATKTASYTLTVTAAPVSDPTINPSDDYENDGDPLS